MKNVNERSRGSTHALNARNSTYIVFGDVGFHGRAATQADGHLVCHCIVLIFLPSPLPAVSVEAGLGECGVVGNDLVTSTDIG